MPEEAGADGMEDSYVPQISARVPWVELDGQVVAFDPVEQELLTLNSSATMVWTLCDGDTTLGELIDWLSSSYQLPAGDIRGDVEKILLEWAGRGLLA